MQKNIELFFAIALALCYLCHKYLYISRYVN